MFFSLFECEGLNLAEFLHFIFINLGQNSCRSRPTKWAEEPPDKNVTFNFKKKILSSFWTRKDDFISLWKETLMTKYKYTEQKISSFSYLLHHIDTKYQLTFTLVTFKQKSTNFAQLWHNTDVKTGL